MRGTPPVRVSSVVYAKDTRRVARFYARTLALVTLEEDADGDLVVVGDGDVEIAVVKIPDALAASIQIDVPPAVCEETPLKCSYLVDDLEHVRAAIAAGGGTKPIANAWRWRGQLHLDGHDPEGNVVQFRTRDA